jgi:hypothetical protein
VLRLLEQRDPIAHDVDEEERPRSSCLFTSARLCTIKLTGVRSRVPDASSSSSRFSAVSQNSSTSV